MTRVCLVRHGETDWNCEGRLQGREDIELNDKGREQAKRSADCLKNYKWDIIVSSTLHRAKETAEIINREIGLYEIYEERDFEERDMGEASGMIYKEKLIKYPDGHVAGEETWDALKVRVMSALNRTVDRFKGKNIIIVSHGGAIRAILCTISDIENNDPKYRMENGSMSFLCHDGERFTVESYNNTV